MGKAKQQIRSNTIKRVTEGSYTNIFHREVEEERMRRQRNRRMSYEGTPQYNCRIKW